MTHEYIPDDEFYITNENMKWVRRLKKVLNEVPVDLELLVGTGYVSIHQRGYYKRELWEKETDMMFAGNKIQDDSLMIIDFDSEAVRPNSESV